MPVPVTLRSMAINALRLGGFWFISLGLTALDHEIMGLLGLLAWQESAKPMFCLTFNAYCPRSACSPKPKQGPCQLRLHWGCNSHGITITSGTRAKPRFSAGGIKASPPLPLNALSFHNTDYLILTCLTES